MPPSHVEPIEHELPGHWSFIVHMRPAMPGVALGRQNPKPGSRLGVGTIGERLVISSVMVSRRMRSTGSTLITVIVQTRGSPTLAMGMGTHGVHSPPGHWSADVHGVPPLGPPTQMAAVHTPVSHSLGLFGSQGMPAVVLPPTQTVCSPPPGQSAAVLQASPALMPGQPNVVPWRQANRVALTQVFWI
ncbi:MAG: hypothetical protein E6J55_01270 [Deltaproteobacteria bacterium]|nr:MAG: hypothetical protein E6J55_01270 [Deltaproteobacteria bacterium]